VDATIPSILFENYALQIRQHFLLRVGFLVNSLVGQVF
jgi:hypothetical protein